jgi:hypothetical protein
MYRLVFLFEQVPCALYLSNHLSCIDPHDRFVAGANPLRGKRWQVPPLNFQYCYELLCFSMKNTKDLVY